MNGPCMEFCEKYMLEHEVVGKTILDVGSYNINGSFRTVLEPYKPSKYFGVDMELGPGVDEVCSAIDLIERFGEESFDIVISTEMLEHAEDWKKTIHNIKTVCKPEGTILITTRSRWFPYHGCPEDFSRFEAQDMLNIFSDCLVTGIMSDYVAPGIFIKARKLKDFKENDLSDYKVYDISGEKPDTTGTV